jgi:transcription elongation factor Elf1
MKRFASTLNCFDWMATTMPSALLETNSELPAHSRTRLLQGAGEAFFFLDTNVSVILARSNWRASLSLSCPIELYYPASPTSSRLGDLTGRDDTPSVDSSLDTRHNDAINPVDDWSRYSSTHLDPDPSTATVPAGAGRAAKHKHTFVSCCAEHCEQTFLRKDHLTQHIRNKHQNLDTTFSCPIDGCTNHSLSLLQLLEHMQQPGHKRDVHFTPIKNAVEKPKCSCGDGLIISGRCKACGFHLV